MPPEQSTDGPVPRSQRTLSTSSTRTGVEGDPRPETDVKMQQPSVKEQKTAITQASQLSPRRLVPTTRSSPPASAPLSRHSSVSSTASGLVSRDRDSRSARRSLRTRPPEPPVTRSTLSELDVSKIIHNPKLRHDINFDPDLHFRPNMDGEKGKKKQDKANSFWDSMKSDLVDFATDRPTFYAHHGESDVWGLPALLKAVKEIIQTLVPQRDRRFLEEGLNVELLMQQFHKGVADLETLGQWLSRVLKSHCAPMRDEWVDTMYDQLSTGNHENDIDMLVTGMRTLLGVLEAMKLDVANHQIRCLRPALIEGTVNFEQSFFVKKMESGKVDIVSAQAWYRRAAAYYAENPRNETSAFGKMGAFFEALSLLVLPSSAETRIPSTFLFDEERILKLRSDMLDAINLEICMRMYNSLYQMTRRSRTVLVRRARSHEQLGKTSLLTTEDFDFNTAPTPSRPSSLVFSPTGSETECSPRSSMALPSYLTPKRTVTRTSKRRLYNSLVCLLSTAPSSSQPSARWEAIAPSMALEMLRNTNAPAEMLETLEETLMSNLFKSGSPLFGEVEDSLHARLLSELGQRVKSFKDLSSFALFSQATGCGTQLNKETGWDGVEEGGIAGVATRLAHLGILHWRVWSQLAYADDVESMSLDVGMTES